MIVDFVCLSYDCIWRVRVKNENKVSEKYQKINVSGSKMIHVNSAFCDLRIFRVAYDPLLHVGFLQCVLLALTLLINNNFSSRLHNCNE